MTRKELRLQAEAYSPDPAIQGGYIDGFKAAMQLWLKEFEPEPDKPKRVTSCALLRGIEVGDSRLVPIRDANDWRRWRVLVHHFNSTYGVYFKVHLNKETRKEIVIIRIF